MNVCSICNSQFKGYIDNCLSRRIPPSEIIKELKLKHDVRFSRSAIYRHRKNHLMLPKRNSTFELLIKTGNYRLVKAIQKTEKILRKYPECTCDTYTPRRLKRRGRVWICSLCQGWVRYDVGLLLNRKFRLPAEKPKYTKLMASARSYSRRW